MSVSFDRWYEDGEPGSPAADQPPVLVVEEALDGVFAQPVLSEAFDQLIGEGRWWRGLLTLYLFSDEGVPFMRAAQLAAQASAARPAALAPGRAGDVFLCHPFLVHAAPWPHTGRQPRIMAQPGVALHDAFPLVPPLSPVELAMTADG